MSRRQARPTAKDIAITRAVADTREAIGLHQAGKLEQARAIYERVLAAAPRHADAWHFQGLLKYQCGDVEAGIRDVQEALKYAPEYADAYANLAIMQLDQRDYSAAERSLKRALILTPKAIPPRVTLARLYRALGRASESEKLLREALQLDPAATGVECQSTIHCGLGNALLSQGRLEEAVEHYKRAIGIKPEARELRAALGHALCRLGWFEKAADEYRAMLARDPDDVRARHLLAACGGSEAPERADDSYVRTVFDGFSTSFEQKLASLGYRAPQLLDELLRESLGPACTNLALLDAGCGTGLFGDRVRAACTRLVGVDLSPGMLQVARTRGIYDDLHEAELTSWLATHPGEFDVVASADTLCYFGALHRAVGAACAALKPGGWLFFSVEHYADASPDYLLQHHGRYAHREPYVEHVLSEAGFGTRRIRQDTLRMESGQPVAGLVVAARRTPS